MTRVAAIGLDAVERDLVAQLTANGALPNLGRIHARSARCSLSTPGEFRSEAVQTEFVTGRSAANNRYWTTVSFDPSTYECVCTGSARQQPFYALGEGTQVVAFDIPHSILDDDVHGAQVLGWGAHSAQFPRSSRPAGVLREIESVVGPHPGMALEYEGSWNQAEWIDRFADALVAGSAAWLTVTRSLLERYPDWDLFVSTICDAHTASHHMWHGIDRSCLFGAAPTAELAGRRLLDVHRGIDDAVGRFADGLPHDTVLVIFSVKGMEAGDSEAASMVLPELLHRAYFGVPRTLDPNLRAWRRVGKPPLVPPPWEASGEYLARQFLGDRAQSRTARLVASARGRSRNALHRYASGLLRARRLLLDRGRGGTPKRMEVDELAVTDALPTREIESTRESLDWHAASWYRDRWRDMPAFVLPSFSDAHVRINLAGREHDGIVPVDRYREACHDVEAMLQACRCARTGRPVIDEITRVRADDPLAPDGPPADLIVRWQTGTDALEHPDVGIVGPVPTPRTGAHTAHGFAWVSGPGIEPRDLAERPLLDLPATIVHLLGREPAARLDGMPMLSSANV